MIGATAKHCDSFEPSKEAREQMAVLCACDPDHYKETPVEVIEILESIVCSPNRKLKPQQKFCIAQAVRYLLRCGLKGEDIDAVKDMQKAENYVHRAMTGKWIERQNLTGGKEG